MSVPAETFQAEKQIRLNPSDFTRVISGREALAGRQLVCTRYELFLPGALKVPKG